MMVTQMNVRGVLLTLAIAALAASCAKLQSSGSDGSTASSKPRGLDEPDTIPGYLIDERSFGYESRDQWLSDINLTPFVSAKTDGSYVVPLTRAVEGDYVVALYGPPREMPCADFVAGLQQRSGSSATADRNFRFSLASSENMELSSDGMKLTIFPPADEPRLTCTALIVATALPDDAGYKPYFGRAALLLASGLDSNTSTGSFSFIGFATNAGGAWETTRVGTESHQVGRYLAVSQITDTDSFILGLPGGRIFEGQPQAWTENTSYQRAFDTDETTIVGFSNLSGGEILAVEGLHWTTPFVAARKRTGSMGTFATFNVAEHTRMLESASMNESGYFAVVDREGPQVKNVMLINMAAGGNTVSSTGVISDDGGGGACSAPLTTTHVATTGIAYFTIRCTTNQAADVSLSFGRLHPSGNRDWLRMVHGPNEGGLRSSGYSAMDVDTAGTTHMLFHYSIPEDEEIKLLYISVSSSNVVQQTEVTVAGIGAEFDYLDQGANALRIRSDPGGNLHVVTYGSSGNYSNPPFHGIYIPGASKLMVKQIGEPGSTASMSPIILY